MIYKREEFIDENPGDEKFPIKQIEQLSSLDGEAKRFVGRVNLGLQTPMGMQSMPVSFEIEAVTVQEAFEKFSARAETEVETARKEVEQQIQEMRRRSQSRIVTPDQLQGGAPKLQL